MISAVIYGTLTVSSKPSIASTRSLQWTPDGQLLVLGETIIHILTPEIGLKLGHDPIKGTLKIPPTTNIPWATTAIPLQPTGFHCAELSSEWSTVCLGSVDFSWSAVTFSPTSYSTVGSCLLATLSSNLEVHLWGPKEDPYRGQWVQIQDVSRDLRSRIWEVEGISSEQRVLRSQIQSISWSPQPPSRRGTNASILAMGTRGGGVILSRMVNGVVSLFEFIQISNEWITHLAWTNWRGNDSSQTAILACGMPYGRIVMLEVRQDWTREGAPTPTVQVMDINPYEDDKRGIVAMEWKQPEGQRPILVHCKPGIVSLWREDGPSGWSGLKTFELHRIVTSKASTCFAPASGIIFIPQQNSLVISLSDGSYNVIHLHESGPTLSDKDDISVCNSNEVSKTSRSVFLVAEEKETPKPKDGSEPPKLYTDHVARTYGALAIDSGGIFIWLHQRLFPESFEFVADSKIRCLLMVAPLISPSKYDEYALEEIRRSITKGNNFFYEAPISILRGSLVQLRRKIFLERNKEAILSILSPDVNRQLTLVKLPKVRGQKITDEWKRMALHEAASLLSGEPLLCGERLKLNLAMLCASYYPKDGQYSNLVSGLQENVERIRIKLMVDLLTQFPSDSVEDSPTSYRIVQRACSIGLGDHEQVKRLSSMIEDIPIPESCPACNKDIQFENASFSRCRSGHFWSRCTTTFAILATPNVKSCIVCGRKMLVYTEKDNDLSRDWLEGLILQATECCPGCGNKCVKTI